MDKVIEGFLQKVWEKQDERNKQKEEAEIENALKNNDIRVMCKYLCKGSPKFTSFVDCSGQNHWDKDEKLLKMIDSIYPKLTAIAKKCESEYDKNPDDKDDTDEFFDSMFDESLTHDGISYGYIDKVGFGTFLWHHDVIDYGHSVNDHYGKVINRGYHEAALIIEGLAKRLHPNFQSGVRFTDDQGYELFVFIPDSIIVSSFKQWMQSRK